MACVGGGAIVDVVVVVVVVALYKASFLKKSIDVSKYFGKNKSI